MKRDLIVGFDTRIFKRRWEMAVIIKNHKNGKCLILDTKRDTMLMKHKTDKGNYGYYKHYNGDDTYYYAYNSRTRSFNFLTKDEMQGWYQMVHAFMLNEKKNGY